MVGSKAYESVEIACNSIVELSKMFKPNKKRVDIYNNKYQNFIKLYPKISDLYKLI